MVCITVELLRPVSTALSIDSQLYVWNMFFVLYYIADLICKIWAQGWELYLFSNANVYEGEDLSFGRDLLSLLICVSVSSSNRCPSYFSGDYN